MINFTTNTYTLKREFFFFSLGFYLNILRLVAIARMEFIMDSKQKIQNSFMDTVLLIKFMVGL